MANKGLKGKYFIPDLIKQRLQKDIDNDGGGKNRRRIIGYLNDGHITDREIAKLLYDYKYNNLGSEEDVKSIEKLIKWAQREVGGKAEHIERTKKSQSDIGLENKHKKTHFKFGDDTKPIQFHNLVDVPKPTTKITPAMNINEEIQRAKELMGLSELHIFPPKIDLTAPKEWFTNILNQLKPSTSPESPNIVFYMLDNDIDMELNKNSGELWVDNNKVWSILKNKFKMTRDQIRSLIKDMVENRYNIQGIRPWPDDIDQWHKAEDNSLKI